MNAALARRTRVIRASARRGGDVDLVTVGVLGALLALGVVMVASASPGGAQLGKHVVALSIALSAGVVAFLIRTDVWLRAGPVLLLIGGALLLTVLVIGDEVNGSRRWLSWGALRVQPSELVKLFMVVFTASFIARKRLALGSAHVMLRIAVALAVVCTLLLLEPDLGAALMVAGVTVALLLLGGMRMTHFAIGALLAVMAVALLIVQSPYRLERLLTVLCPLCDAYDAGYQVMQAVVAFARGELFGVGLGASIQKLFLPHSSNDFLLAVVGEELGLVGTLTVVALFALLLWRGFATATRARERGWFFESLLAQGMTLLLVLQAAVNIGVNLAILPTTGLTLPLVSYGGSSLVVCCIAGGILLAVERKTRRQR